MQSLSERGLGLLRTPPMAAYIEAHFERVPDTWDPVENPEGYIGLCIAENTMMAPQLGAFLGAPHEVPATVLAYDAPIGNEAFRQAIAAFMSERFAGRPIAAEHLIVSAGVGCVLELLFYVLADPGDCVLVPTPSYAGFWADLETRDELRVVTVDTVAEEDFRFDRAQLDAAFEAAPGRVRALLLTSPDNPLGRVYTREELDEIIAWAEARDIHLVVDEIYAMSVFGERPFVSAAACRPRLGDRMHIAWGFSKDFGASGLRCGVLFSENQQVLDAVGALAYWAMCSGHTQLQLRRFLEDVAGVEDYLANMRAGLGEAYARVHEALDRAGIEHVAAQSGFFVVCDLRRHLPTPDAAGEAALWRRLLDEAKVNLTPGRACRISEPGFFRLCYAAAGAPAVEEALRRIAALLAET